MIALYANEFKRTIRLRVITANLLGVAAFCVAGVELTGNSLESRVLAGAHLLTYLTWIAAFQDKKGRQYWWMLALSVMQVAVASILTERGIFGVLLVFYVFCGMWTLAVFSVYQAYHKFERADRNLESSADPLQTGEGQADVKIEKSQTKKTKRSSRFRQNMPLHRQSSEYRSAIQLDPDQRWINGRFVVGVVTTSILSLIVGAIFFALVPRMWVGRRTMASSGGAPIQSMTGFTDEVQLGSLGKILESNKPVLQAWFFEASNNKPLSIEDVCKRHGFRDEDGFATEPLFRGSVMGRYENGRWYVLEESRQASKLQTPQTHSQDRAVRQEYVLEQTGTKTLFGIHPIFWADGGDNNRPKVAMDLLTSILMRDDGQDTSSDSFEYAVYSYSPTINRPVRIGYHPSRIRQISTAKRAILERQFGVMPAGFEKLTELAQQIQSEIPVDDLQFSSEENALSVSQKRRISTQYEATRRMRIANAVESFLGDSADYSYSLETKIVDNEIDPVEDFLINRKEGHCEYYASAMALMMRSLGIESRLVSGFKGGETSLSGAYVVAERHAHAWVEVLVGHQWKTFDPTPASRSDVVREVGEDQSVYSAISEFATGLWHQRVIRLSEQEQKRSIYEPLGKWLKAKLQQFGPMGKAIAQHLSDPSGWFSWQTFVAVFFLVFGGLGIRKLWRRIFADGFFNLLSKKLLALLKSFDRNSSGLRVDFYERFLKILAKQGLTRRASQTHLEFSRAAQNALEDQLSTAGLGHVLDQVARKFYQVRYGDRKLTAAEQAELDGHLTSLEQALATKS
jgi:protein-glutamine gamma-glutamyltransferase